MNTFNLGDKVSVLDDTINGVIISINNNKITIETEDQFLMTYFDNELVKQIKINDIDKFTKSDYLDKIKHDSQLSRKQVELQKKITSIERGVPEFDLHIEKLVKSKNGMSNFDILNLQLDVAKRHIEFSIKNRIPKIVFIHGVGEGILKAELDFLLKRYESISFQDANYQKYGLGATEIYFSQKSYQ